MLGQCTKMIKIKLEQSKGWSEASTKFGVLDIINITKSIIFKFEDQKYLITLLHQSKTKFYTLNNEASLMNTTWK